MGFINGYLNIGTALSGITVLTPPSGAGYAAQAVSYEMVSDGIALNTNSCIFGPILGASGTPWSTISVFGVSDEYGNPVWAGTVNAPFTPVAGELVIVPAASLNLIVGQTPISLPLLDPFALAGNYSSVSGGATSIALDPSLTLSSDGTLSVSSGYFIMANQPIPPFSGAMTSGVVLVSNGAYSNIMAAGSRNALVIQNQDPNNTISLVFGGATAPPSNATPSYQLTGPTAWPPPGFNNYVLDNTVWATSTGIDSVVVWLQG